MKLRRAGLLGNVSAIEHEPLLSASSYPVRATHDNLDKVNQKYINLPMDCVLTTLDSQSLACVALKLTILLSLP